MIPENTQKEQYVSVSIPTSLYKKIEERVKVTEFKSVSDYVAFVLREVLRNIEENEEEKQGFTKEEQESIKKRLKALGYLD